MRIPDAKTRAEPHLSDALSDLKALGEDGPYEATQTAPIRTKAITALAAVQYLHDLVCGQRPPPPPQ